MNKAKEKILLARIQKNKDADSFTEVYEYLSEPIYRFIYFKVSNREIAQDLTADVFLKVWKGLTAVPPKQVRHLKAYFYMTARYTVIDHYRRAARKKEDAIEQVDQSQLAYQTEDYLHAKIELTGVLKCISYLKESYQEVLLLKYVENFTLSEIGSALGKSPVATRVLLHRANKALIREYEQTS